MDFASRYRLERVVHRGTLGTLYLAEQVALKRTVLLRIVAKQIADDPERRQRLVSRIEQLSRADDKTLVPILDLGEIDGQPFYAMERQEGVDLKAAALGEHHLFETPNPPDIEFRTKALRDFLKSCRKLGEGHIQLGDLRAADVLLVLPFRFVLAEPGLASSCGIEGRSHANSLREMLERAFALTLDPSWDAKDRLHARRSSQAMRSSVFHGLSNLQNLDPRQLIDQALETLRSITEHGSSSRQSDRVDVLLHRSGHSGVWKRSQKMLLRLAGAGMALTGLGLLGYSYVVDAADERERTSHSRLTEAARRNDLVALDELARGAAGEPPRVVTAASFLLQDQIERLLDDEVSAVLGTLLDEPSASPSGAQPPGTVAQRITSARATIDAQVAQHTKAIRAALALEDASNLEALLQLIRTDLHPALIRGMLLRLLDSGAPAVARSAAIGFATGRGGRPIHLDERLGKLLLDPKTDPGLALALIGYFSELPNERGTAFLTRTVRLPGGRPLAPNPNRDPFAESLYRSLFQTRDVLRCWIGLGFSEPGSPPDTEARPIHLRAAALFALEKETMDPASALALHDFLRTNDGRLREAAAMQVVRQAHRYSDAVLLDKLRAAIRLTNQDHGFQIIGALIKVLSKRADGQARTILIDALRSRSLPPALGHLVLETAMQHGMVADIDTLADFLVALPDDVVDLIKPLSDKNPAFRQLLTQQTQKITVEPYLSRVALTRCICGAAATADIEVLRDQVRNKTAQPWLRMQALRALGNTDHERALACCQEVIENSTYAEPMRQLAIQIAKMKLGGPETRFLTSKVSVQSIRFAGAFLRSMSKALRDESNKLVQTAAASVMSVYKSSIVEDALADQIAPTTDTALLDIATSYFRSSPVESAIIEDLDRRMIELLEDEDMHDLIKENVLDYLTVNKRTLWLEKVLEVLPSLEADSAARAALTYLSDHVGNTAVDQALLEYIDSPQPLGSRLLALQTLCAPMLRGQTGDFAAIAAILASSEDPPIVFACARVLLAGTQKVASDVLVDAFVRHVRRLTSTAVSTSSRPTTYDELDPAYSAAARSSSPRVVLEIRDPDFDRLLVDAFLDHDLKDEALIHAAATLILRLAKRSEPSTQLDRLLQQQNLDIDGLVKALSGDAPGSIAVRRPLSSRGSYLFQDADYLEVLNYLCGDAYRSRWRYSAFVARAHHVHANLYEYLPRGDDSVASYSLRLEGVIKDIVEGIRLATDEGIRDALTLELFDLQQEAGDDETALATLESYRARRPNDDRVTQLLFDHYLRMGRLEEASSTLDLVAARDSEYWQRKLGLEFRTPEAGRDFLNRLTQRPEWKGQRAFAILPTALSYLHEFRADARFAEVRQRAAERLVLALGSEFSWINRSLAAFHLAWLAPEAHVEALALAARTDANTNVRRNALWGLATAKPDLAIEVALRNHLPNGDADLVPTAYWVLLKNQRAERVEHLKEFLKPGHPLTPLALLLAGACDEAAAIPSITNLLNHQDVMIRIPAVQALGRLGKRGHQVDRERLLLCYQHEMDVRVAYAGGSALAEMGDEGVLAACKGDVDLFLSDSMTPGTAERLLPSRLRVLGQHRSHDTALALVNQVLEHRRNQLNRPDRALPMDPASNRGLASRYKADGDDEALGNLGDLYVAFGQLDAAREMYQLACEIDPLDSEWTNKLDLMRRGGIPSTSASIGDDILQAAMTASAALTPRNEAPVLPFADPAASASAERGPLAFQVLRSVKADNGGNGPAEVITSRLHQALDLLDTWPQYALWYWMQVHVDRTYSPDGYYRSLPFDLPSQALPDELATMFEGRLPPVVRDAADMLAVLPALHAHLAGGDQARSSSMPLSALLREIRERLPSPR